MEDFLVPHGKERYAKIDRKDFDTFHDLVKNSQLPTEERRRKQRQNHYEDQRGGGGGPRGYESDAAVDFREQEFLSM